jgi:hypothetical protein
VAAPTPDAGYRRLALLFVATFGLMRREMLPFAASTSD